MAFRRSVFDVWPGFDERIGRGTLLSGGEEHDAFYNLIERGYRIVYNPAAVVSHPCARSPEELRTSHLKLLAITTAYITRLAVEHPSSRRALRQYVSDRLRGRPRPWAGQSRASGQRIAPRWPSLLAMLSGPWIYCRSRIVGPPREHLETAKPMANAVTTGALRDSRSQVES